MREKHKFRIKKLLIGMLLILIMLGHSYVFYLPQELQIQLEEIHHVNVTVFNLLYTIPSIAAVLVIIPTGFIYHCFPNFTLLLGAAIFFAGQILSSIFGSQGQSSYFIIFIFARCLEVSGAQILYMIQGNLSSSWMGPEAGIVLILPQIGDIVNAFLTPYAASHWGVNVALWIGVIFCFASLVACLCLYAYLKRKKRRRSHLTGRSTPIHNDAMSANNLRLSSRAHSHREYRTSRDYRHSHEHQMVRKSSRAESRDYGRHDHHTDNFSDHTIQSLTISQTFKLLLHKIFDSCFNVNQQIFSQNQNQIHHQQHQNKDSERVVLDMIAHTQKAQSDTGVEIKIKKKDSIIQESQEENAKDTLCNAGKVFWLTIALCTFNECLYYPFLVNANALIQTRFKITHNETGSILCLPFIAAIVISIVMIKVLPCFQRKNLIFWFNFLPLIGHLIITLVPNSNEEIVIGQKIALGVGFFVLGLGMGSYYSVAYPAVGLAVPQCIRDQSFGVMTFLQTIVLATIPIFSGLIIQRDSNHEAQGYRNSSIMYVSLSGVAIFFAFFIKIFAKEHSYDFNDEDEVLEEQNEQQGPQTQNKIHE